MISYATFGNIYLALLWLVIFQFLHIFTGATAPVYYPRICLSEQMFFFSFRVSLFRVNSNSVPFRVTLLRLTHFLFFIPEAWNTMVVKLFSNSDTSMYLQHWESQNACLIDSSPFFMHCLHYTSCYFKFWFNESSNKLLC